MVPERELSIDIITERNMVGLLKLVKEGAIAESQFNYLDKANILSEYKVGQEARTVEGIQTLVAGLDISLGGTKLKLGLFLTSDENTQQGNLYYRRGDVAFYMGVQQPQFEEVEKLIRNISVIGYKRGNPLEITKIIAEYGSQINCDWKLANGREFKLVNPVMKS